MSLPLARLEATGRRLGTACAAAVLLVLALVLGVGGTPPGASDDSDAPAAVLASSPRDRAEVSARRCTGRVALTFDDGPAVGTTLRLVRILRREKVTATFFVVGQHVRAHPELVRAIERSGLLIGNHSWAHEQLTARSDREIRDSIRGTDRVLRRAGVHPTHLLRPPYGAMNDRVRADIVRLGYRPVLWTIDSRDWANGTAPQIAGRILRALHPGNNIVLQHDGVTRSPISVDAVTRVIRTARRRGYCFTGLDERGLPGFPSPLASVSVRQGAEGGFAVATVRLDRMAGRRTAVTLSVRSGSATVGTDLADVRTRVVIPAGRLTASVRIPILADGLAEPVERAAVDISAPSGVRIGRGTASLVIGAVMAARTGRWSPVRPLPSPAGR
ncbi:MULTISPECIES: polysaccharide deacetylase family protein [unclassified Nocardioides]|uniref:polysaccharide deacetylase family protein n=1 Tax=unclassified Nocardioides TaxID=2615069 RepID=UPI000A8E147C|nr:MULTISPECIES: polysaccharide deacetylase family protein [unclassified Nocardioides]